MKLAVYVDESGRDGKSESIVVSGWIDWSDNWSDFCFQWQSALNKYNAPFFHFQEWAYASYIIRSGKTPSSSFKENPYKDWPLEKLDEFLYEMAELAGGGNKLFVGGFISTKDFVETKKYSEYSRFAPADDLYQACLNQFFEKFSMEVQQQWPYWTDPVAFFFDRNGDLGWKHAAQSAFEASSKKDPRLAELSFVNGDIPPHLPIQAADMIASRTRQIVEKFTDPTIFPNPSRLDDLLIKAAFERSSPAYLQAAFGDFQSVLPLRYGNFPWRNKI